MHQGLGKTGVIGTLRVGNDTRSIGLRADMDALPMAENNTFSHKSTNPNVMHACGHDGHTTMLLGAAKYLAESKNFEGCVHFIFQPGEEGVGGAKAMVEDGLFDQFPCDSVYGMHNRPGMAIGKFGMRSGAAWCTARIRYRPCDYCSAYCNRGTNYRFSEHKPPRNSGSLNYSDPIGRGL